MGSLHWVDERLIPLHTHLYEAYEFYKIRGLEQLSDEYILKTDTADIIKEMKRKSMHLSPGKIEDPEYKSTKDLDGSSVVDIYIPFTGTINTLNYCPDQFLNNPPQILAQVHKKEEKNIIRLRFKESEINNIEPVIELIKEYLREGNKEIENIDLKLEPELILAIENKRLEIKKKYDQFDMLGLKKLEPDNQEKKKILKGYKFYNEYRKIILYYSDGTIEEDSFSERQAKALLYMEKEHKKGKPTIPQKNITDAVGSVSPKIRNIFKITKNDKTKIHPCFTKIMYHDNCGNYAIIKLKALT